MTRKSILILVALVALLAIGVFTVMAQEGDDTPPFGRGMMHGRHGAMMGGGFGYGMMSGDGHPMLDTAAEALGLEPDAVRRVELQPTVAIPSGDSGETDREGIEAEAAHAR